MRPKTIMDRGKSDTQSLAEERRQHHVARVQGMDEVWRESISLLHHVRPTVTKKLKCVK